MQVYHLGRQKFARQLSGEGARLHGGRWNVVGVPCLYASLARSLCVLEFAANVPLEQMPADLCFTVYEIPAESLSAYKVSDLPPGWDNPSPPAQAREWGTKQLQNHLALRLPSVVLPSEFNVVLNPLHPDFKKVRIAGVEAFNFDVRIKS